MTMQSADPNDGHEAGAKRWLSSIGLFALLLLAGLSGCATEGGKINFEHQLNISIGKIAEEYLSPGSLTSCGIHDGSYGCVYSQKRYDCSVWLDIDEMTGQIASWRYIDRPESCWHMVQPTN